MINKPELICMHCNKQIDKIVFNGISIVCPHCGKPNESKINIIKSTSVFKSGLMMFEQTA